MVVVLSIFDGFATRRRLLRFRNLFSMNAPLSYSVPKLKDFEFEIETAFKFGTGISEFYFLNVQLKEKQKKSILMLKRTVDCVNTCAKRDVLTISGPDRPSEPLIIYHDQSRFYTCFKRATSEKKLKIIIFE